VKLQVMNWFNSNYRKKKL